MKDPDAKLPQRLQKEIFVELVQRQDKGASVSLSRAKVAEKFKVTEATVRDIERTGLEQQWPPLS